jgi:hypothetical protein
MTWRTCAGNMTENKESDSREMVLPMKTVDNELRVLPEEWVAVEAVLLQTKRHEMQHPQPRTSKEHAKSYTTRRGATDRKAIIAEKGSLRPSA